MANNAGGTSGGQYYHYHLALPQSCPCTLMVGGECQDYRGLATERVPALGYRNEAQAKGDLGIYLMDYCN